MVRQARSIDTRDPQRPGPDAQQAQQRAGGDVDRMVLVRREHRADDQQRPGVQHRARPARRELAPIQIPQDDDQRARAVEGAWLNGWSKPRSAGEQPARRAIGRRLAEAVAQRKGDEAGHGDALRRQQPRGMAVQLAAVARDEQRQAIENVQAPVREDRPGPERDLPFPVKTPRWAPRRATRPDGWPGRSSGRRKGASSANQAAARRQGRCGAADAPGLTAPPAVPARR